MHGRAGGLGRALAAEEPPAQAPPAQGTAPRVDAERAARELRALPHVLLGCVGADGFPVVTPVTVGEVSAAGIRAVRRAALPGGGRRAGVMAHRYGKQLVGLAVRQHTGWLQDGVYAPHTESGFRAPANKTAAAARQRLHGAARAEAGAARTRRDLSAARV